MEHLEGTDGSTVHTEKNEDNLLFSLLQSEHLSRLAEKYPEVLYFDGTYRVNLEEYVLHSVLRQDPTGKCWTVCCAFVQRETSEIETSELEIFLPLNPIIKRHLKFL